MKRLLPLLLPFFLVACEKTVNTTVPINNNPPPGNALKTWLALGDSYTIGQGVGDAERFPAQTANWLKQNGININVPYYIATTGWTTVNLQSAINDQNPGTYDVVSLLIGVNDQYQTHDTTGYRQRFTDLLVKAIQLARGKKENVFVLSIPDYSVTPLGFGCVTARIRPDFDRLTAINKSVTNR